MHIVLSLKAAASDLDFLSIIKSWMANLLASLSKFSLLLGFLLISPATSPNMDLTVAPSLVLFSNKDSAQSDKSAILADLSPDNNSLYNFSKIR